MTSTSPSLADNVAVVAGGASDLGAAAGRALAGQGASVVVADQDEAAIAAVVGDICASGGRAVGIRTNWASSAEIERMRDLAVREAGAIDILLAFVSLDPVANATRQCKDDACFAFARDLTTTFLLVRTFLPGMVERGHGLIVTLPSVAVFARHVAKSAAGHGVQVTALEPSVLAQAGTGPANSLLATLEENANARVTMEAEG